MGKRAELDSKDVTFHFRGIPKTEDELKAKKTSNKVLPIQVQSEAFD
jgi:hypothetical protein